MRKGFDQRSAIVCGGTSYIRKMNQTKILLMGINQSADDVKHTIR